LTISFFRDIAKAPFGFLVAGGVVADDMFIGVVVTSDNRQFFHVETGLLEFFNGRFGRGVSRINRGPI
jgi:hypothetical protein